MNTIPKVCSVPNCGKAFHAKGLCKKHWAVPEYQVWASMKSRCANRNHPQYYAYGARGIKVCDQWLVYKNFIADMGTRPSSEYSIDRIDNNKGYSPNNCRWATKSQQQQNRRKLKHNKSGYIGVSRSKKSLNRYRASINLAGTVCNLGEFTDPDQAALQYDRAVVFFRGKYGVTNFL